MVGAVIRPEPDTERSHDGAVDVVLASLPRSISAARRAVAGLLDPALVPAEVVEDVMLLVSELVTNAVLHARSAVHLSACVEPGRILVAVGDNDPDHGPLRPDRGAMATSGRGIRLVELLASSWGVETSSRSKVVWFEVHHTSTSSPQAVVDLRLA